MRWTRTTVLVISIVMSIVLTTLDAPKNPAERRAWVCFQLRLRGNSLSKIARQEKVSQQAVSNALMTPSCRLEQAIAEALGLTAKQLFPERFDGMGFRLAHTRLPQRTTRSDSGNVEEEKAA